MSHRDRDPFKLTPRENEVVKLLADGLTRRQVCDRLGISTAAMSQKLTVIRRKLDASTDGGAIAAWRAQQRWAARANAVSSGKI